MPEIDDNGGDGATGGAGNEEGTVNKETGENISPPQEIIVSDPIKDDQDSSSDPQSGSISQMIASFSLSEA